MSAFARAPIAGSAAAPSALYGARLWQLAVRLTAVLPRGLVIPLLRLGMHAYWWLAPNRRAVVIGNLTPAMGHDVVRARQQARRLYREFAQKLADLWRYEAGLGLAATPMRIAGWEHYLRAHERGRGVLLLTVHLGNWELGALPMAQYGIKIKVITQDEPGTGFTELRQQARARLGVETLIIGQDPFGVIEIIRALEAGETVALLIDRPPPEAGVLVDLFDQPFFCSAAAADLARAAGCALVPVYIVRDGDGYLVDTLPEIDYPRAALRNHAARHKLNQQIMRAFEPAIRQYSDQWYHFVPVWPRTERDVQPPAG